jgi:hypothetical protein
MAGETRDDGRFARWFELKLISAAIQVGLFIYTPSSWHVELNALQHQEVASVLWRVRNMIAAERALLAPTVLWKALWTRSRF